MSDLEPKEDESKADWVIRVWGMSTETHVDAALAQAARGFLKLPHEEADALRFIQEWRDLAVFTSGASSFMLIFSEIATGPGRVLGVDPPEDVSFYGPWFEKYHASDLELLSRV